MFLEGPPAVVSSSSLSPTGVLGPDYGDIKERLVQLVKSIKSKSISKTNCVPLARSLDHGVRAVGNHDALGVARSAAFHDGGPACGIHVETVNQLVDFNLHIECAVDLVEKIGQMGLVERKCSADLVIALIERSAGDDDLNCHTR